MVRRESRVSYEFFRIVAAIFAVAAVAVYGGIFAYLYLHQDRMAFPAPLLHGTTTPRSLGMPFEDLHLPVGEGEQIHAWCIPAAQRSSVTLLFFHGNADDLELSALGGEVEHLHAAGANLLMVDYRGYGSSTRGQATGARALEDGRVALRYLLETRHVPLRQIVLVGRSIGTGIAAKLAAENPDVGGLVLLSPFTTLAEVARHAIGLLRLMPLSLLGSRNRMDNLEAIRAVKAPLLMIVGKEDILTPPWMAERLFAEAREPKELYILPGADHNYLWQVGGEALVDRLRQFIRSVTPAA